MVPLIRGVRIVKYIDKTIFLIISHWYHRNKHYMFESLKIISWILCAFFIMFILGYWSSLDFEKVSKACAEIKKRKDIRFQSLCKIDFIIPSGEDSYYLKGERHFYLFDFGIAIVSIRQPHIIKRSEIVYLFFEEEFKNEISCARHSGRLDEIICDLYEIRFSTINHKGKPDNIRPEVCRVMLKRSDFLVLVSALRDIKNIPLEIKNS